MNPTVKKLAEQAGFNVYEDGNFRVDPGQWINAELEKFAELLIRGCVEIVETQRVPVGNSKMAAKWTMDSLRECRDKIKEHFGVEP